MARDREIVFSSNAGRFKSSILGMCLLLAVQTVCLAQERILYKEIDTTKLYVESYYPSQLDTTKTYPSIVFFFGGGWNSGSIKQFEPQAKHFAEMGMICFLVEYRVNTRHHSTPFESLKDAKSAIRFVRENHKQFNVDPNRIVASGASAGGQLAAAAAMIEGYNDPTDNLVISCIPNALVLFNPVIDNGPGGYGFERIGDQYKYFSPLHNIQAEVPPTIMFFGTKDKYVPVATAVYFKTVVEKVGGRCDLKLYEGAGHGFFNLNRGENYGKTLAEADAFLQSLGYILKE